MIKEKQFIFSHKLAKHLIHKGFQVIDLEPSKKDPKLWMYVFKWSPELQLEMDDYFANLKKAS